MQKSQTQRAPQTKWIEVPENLKLGVPFLKAVPLRPVGAEAVQYQAMTDRGIIKLQIPNNQSFMVSNGEIYDDMCNMDILNQPQILNNLVERYKKDKIFTFIGPTLIVVNPYRVIPEYFSPQSMSRIRDKILSGGTNTEKPHIYLIAGNAYISMIDQQKKQAIVISGESGAGKTESTKYCMQILTSLSHKESLPIEAKILACNPILEAFGNSKTTRNDNSSRFGKYVQIYFQGGENTIVGASVRSYLLQKSRVVASAEKQRSFHIFYALIASQKFDLKKPTQYNYLSRSKCYEAAGINDKEYFSQIKKSMKSIGFSENQENKIWILLCSILQLGNIQFDDTLHKDNQSKPCEIKNKNLMQKVAKNLGMDQVDLEKILLFEKKKFQKKYISNPYNKDKCIANINTLSKAIYNAIFQFILFKIQRSLQPSTTKNYLSINILDIFGFENFQVNSFEQFCINFTNEKLLKLYNRYVFEKQMQILKDDGLYQQVANIKPPTNEAIIETISGKLSLFSLINDSIKHLQFKDSDIISGFQAKIKSPHLKFDKFTKTKFIIVHSQCNVKYQIQGFKEKNQDKVLPEILDIVTNLFDHESKEQVGNTLLTKFSVQIEDLMSQLNSSCVHFIRCIKPNEKKIPNLTQENFMMTQIRYLGVFETIQIRKKTFPSRWLYEEFIQRFQSLFPLTKGSVKAKTQKIINHLSNNKSQFLFGNKRVYMNSDLQLKLSKKLHEHMKKKVQSAKKILKFYRKSKFRKQLNLKLKTLVKRIRIWKAFCAKQAIKIEKNAFKMIKQMADRKKEQERILMSKKLMEAKQKREEQQKKQKQLNIAKKNQHQIKYCTIMSTIRNKCLKRHFFNKMKALKSQAKAPQKVSTTATPSTATKPVTKNQPISKPKPQQSYQTNNLNESTLNQSVIFDTREGYQRQITGTDKKKGNYQFNQSFLNNQSVLVTNDKSIIFEGTLSVRFFQPKQATKLQKLKLILAQKYQDQYNQSQQDYFSPISDDAAFQIHQTDDQLMNKINTFDSKQFFKEVLRKRTNFFGIQKNEEDILVAKPKPISKSLTLISQNDQKQAIRIFKSLLKISQQAKLQNVFKLIEVLIGFCHGTSPQLKNQVFIQLLKQSNTQVQLSSVRILQTMAVYLHIFSPDKNFLIAGLNFFFNKLSEQKFTQKQNDYIRYNFKKIIRKIDRVNNISYMPIKYQIMALMCKRKISLPVYLPIGSSVLIRVESYETFSDIKARVMEQFGINSKRLLPDYFSFFEIVNFDNQQIEQSPIQEHLVVWDTITYWQKAKDKYKQKGIIPPIFFMMLKLKYTFQCHYSDEEAVQIMFGQSYFEYFIGRVRLDLDDMGALAGCTKKLKFSNTPADDYKICYPAWALKKYNQKQLINKMKINYSQVQKQGLSQYDIKFMFIAIAAKSPFCMCLVVSTDQNIKIYFKPKKILITDKFQIVQQIPIKSITKYAENADSFIYSVRGSSQNKVVYTEHASICCQYLSLLPNLVKLKFENHNNNNVLGSLN